jgi:hypothetical protein
MKSVAIMKLTVARRPARPAKLPEGICRYLGHGAGRPAG